MKDVCLILYPAADVTASKQFFGKLTGTEPYVDSAQYVGYKSGDLEIGLVPGKKEAGALPYWTVTDIAEEVKALEAAGGSVVEPIRDVGYGMLVASVEDPSGSLVGLRQSPKG